MITMNKVFLNKKTIALTCVFVEYNEQDRQRHEQPFIQQQNNVLCGKVPHSGIWGHSFVSVCRYGMQIRFHCNLLGVLITVLVNTQNTVCAKVRMKLPLFVCVALKAREQKLSFTKEKKFSAYKKLICLISGRPLIRHNNGFAKLFNMYKDILLAEQSLIRICLKHCHNKIQPWQYLQYTNDTARNMAVLHNSH